MVFNILVALITLPVIFAVLVYFNIFSISFTQIVVLFVFAVTFSLIDFLFIKNQNMQIFAMYFGILSINILIFLIGYDPNVSASMCYAFCPIIVCLYYNPKFTRNSVIFSYIIMVAAIYLKSFNIVDVFVYKNRSTQMSWFIPEIIGLTIQYFFACLTVYLLTKRTQGTFLKLINTINQRNEILSSLKLKNKEVIELNETLHIQNKTLIEIQLKIMHFVAEVLGSHDLFTGRHIMHTQKYVEIIARKMRDMGLYNDELTDRNIALYSSAAVLHDIGKVHVPDGILNKTGKFLPEEFERMKNHTVEGKKLLQFLPPIENGEFNKIASQMAYYHHEKWNGSGYPSGISEKNIPLCARIMAAADVIDALISQRLYKSPMSIDEAMHIFEESRGTHFEPCIVDAVLQCRSQIEVEDRKFKEQETVTNEQELEWWQAYHAGVSV